jgi:hypothetical protein
MSKTPRKSLITVLVAFCLIAGQAALFGTGAKAASTPGTTVVFAAGSAQTNAQGTATTITLQGTGYHPGSTVTVYFNAPFTASGANVPAAGNTNVVTATQLADSAGNIGTTAAGSSSSLTGAGAGIGATGLAATGVSATGVGATTSFGASNVTITGAVVSATGVITAGTITGATPSVITSGSTITTTTTTSGTVSAGTVTTGTVGGTSAAGGTISGALTGGTLSAATLGGVGSVTAGSVTAGTVTGYPAGGCSAAAPCTLTGVTLSGATISGGTISAASLTAGTLAGGTFSSATVTGVPAGPGVAGHGPISLTIPATVPAGTYAIVASDGTNISAPLYYTVTGPSLTATVVGGYTSTPPTGANAAAAVPSVQLGGELSVVGTGLNASLPVVFELRNINAGAAGTPVDVPLTVVSCPAFPSSIAPATTTGGASFGGVTTFATSCSTDTAGNVFATVQLPAAVSAAAGYVGQTWGIYASNGVGVGTATPALVQKVIGIHIDNTLATLTPSAFAAAPGVPVTISGAGFAPGSTITITSAPGGVAATTQTVTADANGRIPAGTTYTIPFGTTSGTVTLTATDTFGNSTTAVIGVNAAAAVSGTLGLSPSTASVGQTVTFTGTGFVALDVVTIKLTSSAGTCGTAGVIATTLVANSSGGINGTFAVPTCVVTAPNTATGVTVTVTATGASNGVTASNTLAIRPVALSISQAPGTTTNQIVITGSGFQANENVGLTYTPVPATAASITPGTSNNVTVTADATGAFTTTVTNAYGNYSGYYTVTGTGLSSGFTTTASSAVQLGGYLSFPASVVPGQVFVISGTDFSPGTGTASVNFAPTPATSSAFTISAAGTFTATITVPTNTTPGSYTVTVNAPVPNTTGTQTRTAAITVTALPTSGISLSAPSGPVGGTVVVSGTGYAPNEPVTISIQYGATSGLSGTNVPGTTQTFTASSTGAISATYSINSTVASVLTPGSYNIAVTGVNSGIKNVLPFTISGNITNTTPSSIYFAEGYTGQTSGGASANFNETLSILNSNNYTTTYTVSYFKVGASAPMTVTGTIGAFSVVQRSVNTDVGAGAQVAAEVSSTAPIAAERIITRTTATGTNLGASTSLGQTLNLSATAPASGFDYYFASGAVQLTNEEYLTILNPNATAASVTINILPQTAISATAPVSIAPIAETVPAMSRLTVPLRATLIKAGAPVGFQFGLDVNSTLPIAAENVMYQGDGSGSAKYGSTTVPAGNGSFRQYLFAADFGVAPSSGLASGAVGTGNDVSQVDIINPGPAANGSATVTVSFFGQNGAPINSQQVQVDGGTRETVSVNDIAGVNPNVFSVVVTSDKNVYVELPIAFGGDPSKGGMYATEDIPGAVPGLSSAAFPYLDAANGTTTLSSTVFLYNPGASSITVNAVYSAGTKSVTKSYTVAANSIAQVNVGTDAAGLGVTSGIGGFFSVSSGTPGSLVAFAQSNTTDYKWVIGTQGTYASGFSSGM